MADQKISQLTLYTTPLVADLLPIVDTANGITKAITWANLFKSPTLITPNIGVASGTSLTLAGTLSGVTTLGAVSIALTGAITGATGFNGLVITANTGVITTGAWQGTLIAGTFGGTGVNNGSFTITLAGNLVTTGAFNTTFAQAATTTVTLPSTSSTMARTDAGQTFTGVNVFTSPKIITQISDTNGNVLVNIGATASAVNYVKITNAATGTAGPQIAADGETNVDLKITAKGTGLIHHQHGTYQDIQTYSPTGGGTATLDLSLGNIHHITMPAGNITIALSNGVAGQCFIIRILQDSIGSRTVTWFTTIKWAGGVAPTLTATASKADTLGFEITGTNTYDGFVVGANL